MSFNLFTYLFSFWTSVTIPYCNFNYFSFNFLAFSFLFNYFSVNIFGSFSFFFFLLLRECAWEWLLLWWWCFFTGLTSASFSDSIIFNTSAFEFFLNSLIILSTVWRSLSELFSKGFLGLLGSSEFLLWSASFSV